MGFHVAVFASEKNLPGDDVVALGHQFERSAGEGLQPMGEILGEAGVDMLDNDHCGPFHGRERGEDLRYGSGAARRTSDGYQDFRGSGRRAGGTVRTVGS